MDYTSFAPGKTSKSAFPPPSISPEPRRSFTPKFIAVIFLLLMLGAAAYAGIQYWQDQLIGEDYAPVFTPRIITSNLKTYINSKYGFEVKIPEDWIVKEPKELNNVFHTISFEAITNDKNWNSNTAAVFQIRVYSKKEYDAEVKQCQLSNNSSSSCLRLSYILGQNSANVFVNYSPAGPGLNDSPSDFDYAKYQIGETSSKTFKLTDSVTGQFCGGIATGAFPCPSGYSCKLNGTYPDAGGTCVKQGAICAQVITRAKNLQTGETKDFPTPCDVPTGWQKISF